MKKLSHKGRFVTPILYHRRPPRLERVFSHFLSHPYRALTIPF
jgi:hypothetical protein